VINELREDATARQRFLDACGLHGAMLALSRAGGVAGERTLPLLVDDSDWDRLGDRMLPLVGQLEDHELTQLLIALHSLRAVDIARTQKHEARGLSANLLTAAARRWNREHRPLSPSVLAHWYALKDWAPGSVQPPQLGLTWAELYPASPTGQLDRSELARTDEWLLLAQTLRVHDPDTLENLGFFERDQELLTRLAKTLDGITDQDSRPLAESILTRIQELAPGSAYLAARHALSTIEQEAGGAQQWWVPEDIPSPPSNDPVSSRPVEFDREDVDRVLSDL
jgi:hypothetical protein